MTLNDTINLISIESVEDADGYTTQTETLTEVRCDSSKGVTRSEFYEAYKAGISLSMAFEMWAADYAGETLLEHDGTRYKVERSFMQGDLVQLNCSEAIR